MAYPSYGYGDSYGYNTVIRSCDEYSAGAYNPRHHYQAAQNAGFELGSIDGLPRTIYVGNLDSSVTEEFVTTLFGQIGLVTKTKVICDSSNANDPYAFIEFVDHYTATQALQAMNKRLLLDKEMKVNWATKPGTLLKTDTSKHFHVFVGDLSPEIDNRSLKEAFEPFGELSDTKVIRDMQTLKSKGYGFISYPKREEAERAIEQMNGQWLGRRTIRTNWASRKPTEYSGYQLKPTYDEIYNSTGVDNTSVYIGNISTNLNEDDIRSAFKQFGIILDIRHFKAQGYSFVRYETKEAAARAITEMCGYELNNQPIKCSWGKIEEATRLDTNSQTLITQATGNSYALGNNTITENDAAAQQYWNYYQHYYSSPQYQQHLQAYWQQVQQMTQQQENVPAQSRQSR